MSGFISKCLIWNIKERQKGKNKKFERCKYFPQHWITSRHCINQYETEQRLFIFILRGAQFKLSGLNSMSFLFVLKCVPHKTKTNLKVQQCRVNRCRALELDQLIWEHLCCKHGPSVCFGETCVAKSEQGKEYSSDPAVLFLFSVGHFYEFEYHWQLLTKRLNQKKLEHENFQCDSFKKVQ